MKVKFKKLRENAKLPTKAHEDDFCYDVYACDCEEVAPNVYKYPLGFALQIDKGENVQMDHNSIYPFSCGVIPNSETLILSIDFRPRSSVWKTGMVLCNSCGTVDRGYTGEVCAFFYHVMPDMPKYEPGDRVAQMKIGFTVPIEFEEVEELDKTERGDGGFGSTGKN
jgi:dUTP pyrophosphatase